MCLINEGPYADKRQDGTSIRLAAANRLVLLGVLYGGPLHIARGDISIAPLPTTFTADGTASVPQMIHLGYYVKAREILTIIAHLEEMPIAPMPEPKQTAPRGGRDVHDGGTNG